ncbi:hypothetical protein [Oceanimonas smirnovii]|uniref:hypothetical protein n=1 Tax=Oceanimonas smirnovii TaxID=264574 RepID=UPI003FD11E27
MSNNERLRQYIQGRVRVLRKQAIRDLGMSESNANSAFGALVKTGELISMGDGWYRVTSSDRQRQLMRLAVFGVRGSA